MANAITTQLGQADAAKGVGTPTNSFAGDTTQQLGALSQFASTGRTHFVDEDELPGDLTEGK